MTERTSRRIAYSAYVSANPENSTEVAQARRLLMEFVRKLCPEFFLRLQADVFPHFEELLRQGQTLEDILWTRSPYRLLPEGELKRALASWAAEFNVSDAEWVLDGALRTLNQWHAIPDLKAEQEWTDVGPVFSFSVRAIGELFKFEFAGWETELLDWTRYSKSVRQHFETALQEYRHRTVEAAKGCGLVAAQKKYNDRNLKWFVLYQFTGLSSTNIAKRIDAAHKHSKADESTVLKGIRAAAKLTGWAKVRTAKKNRTRKIR